MDFATQLENKFKLEKLCDDASAKLKSYPVGYMGLTPESIKALPEWKAAAVAYNDTFANLRAFNKVFIKKFSKEYRQYMRDKRI